MNLEADLMIQLDTPTLLVVLVLSNTLIAAVLWIAFAGAFRAGLGQWTAGLIAQGFAWLVLLASHNASDHGPAVIAGTLLVFGCFLHVSAVLAFYQRPIPKWLRYGLPIAALSSFAVWLDVEAVVALGTSETFDAWLLPLHALTIVCSFAFLLMHEMRARELATTDPLTGVYNRRLFKELAENELSRARRAGTPVSVLALDLDRFKRINDAHGHLAGDKVLVAFAALVRGCLRKEDLLARYGGEEFIALLPAATQSATSTLAERIRRKLANTELRAAGKNVRITVSIGVASERGRSLPPLQDLLARADEALYTAKAEGRNRVVISGTPLAIAA